jgi:hypothetical protein
MTAEVARAVIPVTVFTARDAAAILVSSPPLWTAEAARAG